MTSKCTMITTLITLLLTSPSVWAQSARREQAAGQPVVTRFARDIARRHDRGVMVHAEAGLGYGFGAGLGAAGALGLGYLWWEQVALSLEGWGMWGTQGGFAGVGPGLTYFFPASSLQLRWTMGPVARSLQDAPTSWSPGASLGLGLTPYLSPNASLGLGLLLGTYIDPTASDTRAGFMLGLTLSWTLN